MESSDLFTSLLPWCRCRKRKRDDMAKRFVSIWFRHLITDWFTLCQPRLRELPFVISAPSHGRIVITAANTLAEQQGIHVGMVVADEDMVAIAALLLALGPMSPMVKFECIFTVVNYSEYGKTSQTTIRLVSPHGGR